MCWFPWSEWSMQDNDYSYTNARDLAPSSRSTNVGGLVRNGVSWLKICEKIPEDPSTKEHGLKWV